MTKWSSRVQIINKTVLLCPLDCENNSFRFTGYFFLNIHEHFFRFPCKSSVHFGKQSSISVLFDMFFKMCGESVVQKPFEHCHFFPQSVFVRTCLG